MFKMKDSLLIIFFFFVEYIFSSSDLKITLSHCCNMGKTWSMEKKSCNITLPYPLLDVDYEHNTMCLTTVGACCLLSLREINCYKGKDIALKNGICDDKTQQGKNRIDLMMCCEICKIGITVGSTKTICQSTQLFFNRQWDEIYQSCCNTAITEVKTISTENKRNYYTAAINNPCTNGKYNCTTNEKYTSTTTEIDYRNSKTLPLSIVPENLKLYKKKQNCNAGYAYDILEHTCKDIDECIQRPCDINQMCENTLGSFKCHCKNGFQLDKITNACTDINECQLNLHTCQESQRCDNTVGSFQCVRFTGCGTGYTLDVESALCIDDDECTLRTDTCSFLGPDWICRNTLGSFRCERKRCAGSDCRVQTGSNSTTVKPSAVKCLRGYEMDNNNKCTDINECRSPTRCSPNELCINTNGSYYCLPKSKDSPR